MEAAWGVTSGGKGFGAGQQCLGRAVGGDRQGEGTVLTRPPVSTAQMETLCLLCVRGLVHVLFVLVTTSSLQRAHMTP